MAMELTSPGLPLWTLESVSELYRYQLLACKDNRRWRHCAICGASPAEKLIYKCSGCSDPGPEICDPVRYCSVTCQKVHWPIHRSDCGDAKVMTREILASMPSDDASVRRYRWTMRRATTLLGYGGLFDWATRQMFLNSGMSPETIRKNCVIFVVTNHKSLYNSSLFLGHINYEPRDPTRDREAEPPCHFEVHWTNENEDSFCMMAGSCRLENPIGGNLFTQVPQWLYVIRQCCLAGDFHPLKAQVRLELLVNTLLIFRDPGGILNEFKQDNFTEWDLMDEPDDKYPRWESLIGPVVNNL